MSAYMLVEIAIHSPEVFEEYKKRHLQACSLSRENSWLGACL